MPLVIRSGARARALALAFAVLATVAALPGCDCGSATDAGPPIDAGDFAIAIGTPTDVMAGFRLLSDGDSVELVLGSQGATMIFLRYVVPESAAPGFSAIVILEIEGFPPFERGPLMGAAVFEAGIGYVTSAHRLVLNDLTLLTAEGLGIIFTVTVTDGKGRTDTAVVNAVLHDDVPCQDLGPGFCVPYGDSGTPNPSDSATGADAGDGG